jgi:hypothetical protein
MRFADEDVQRQVELGGTAGSDTSAKIMFGIVFGLFICSMIGIYGAVYRKLGHLRFYAFFLLLLICAQLSTLMVLVLEANNDGGALAQVETTAGEQLKLDAATAFREQYCTTVSALENTLDALGGNSTRESQATCLGRNSSVSDDYCMQRFQTELELARAQASALTVVSADESMCPSECSYRERVYITQVFNNTQLQLDREISLSTIWEAEIWGDNSHSMCDCNPSQETDEEKHQFLSCMHAFYLKNIALVIIIIAATIISEIFLGVFGWNILRPWAERRLAQLASRPNNHNERSKNWNVVAAFALP